MRNTCEVVIDQDGVYLAIGVDRRDADFAHFVRLDVNRETFFIGPKGAKRLAGLLLKYAEQADGST